MPYAKVMTSVREATISLDLTSWGAPYQLLFDQTDVSGYEAFLAYSHDNFNNPFQHADEQRYKDRGYWTEIFRDKIVDSTAKNGLQVVYISHAGTKVEKEHKVTAPANGWYVPDGGVLFVPDTLIPVRTVKDLSEAQTVWNKAGLPQDQTSYFLRSSSYKNDERVVGRDFLPLIDNGVCGRFMVMVDRSLSSGDRGVASRPRYEELKLS